MKKQQILDAATELFFAKGYGQVSMDLVAREAGVSKATLYAHFSDKKALFKESLSNYYRLRQIPVPKMPERAADNLTGLVEHLSVYLHEAFAFYSNDDVVRLYRLLISEVNQFPELFELFFNKENGQMTASLADYLTRFCKECQFQCADCYFLACQILDLLRGASIWTKLTDNPAKKHFTQNQESTLVYLNASVKLLVENYLLRSKENQFLA